MDVLPFTCPRHGHSFKKSPPVDDKRPYSCSCGQVVLSCTVLDYLDPFYDKDGQRAKLVRDLITEAWNQDDLAPYINAPTFDRRLAELKRPRSLFHRMIGR